MKNSLLFDEYYYAHDCGRPYQRDAGWLSFFDQIALRIIEQINPGTVLDAGCAWGFLVEGFRKHAVEAFGVDISEYAIENVHPEIKPYCWVGSIIEPFPRHYDLITCIEVLEHMPKLEAETAIENFCSHTNEVVFSSTPFDYKEATHVNVHDPEYWAEQFARHGFYRDMGADMSFITTWAVRFVKTNKTNSRLVVDYERKLWQLWKENYDLRHSLIETQEQLRQQEKTADEQKVRVAQINDPVILNAREIPQPENKLSNNVILKGSSSSWFKSADIRTMGPLERLTHIALAPVLKMRSRNEIKTNLPLIRNSKLFDESWYLNRNPDVAHAMVDPALHFLLYGGFEGRDPGPKFQSSWYLEMNQDVKNYGINPLIHYLKYGKQEGRSPRPDQPNVKDPINSEQNNRQSDYAEWIASKEPSNAEKQTQQKEADDFSYKPLISLILPVWNTPKEILDQTFSSVFQQTYRNWELCIADGDSAAETKRELAFWSEADPRIKTKFLDVNNGIAKNSNAALSLANGEFVGFLDHDDLISPFALFEVVKHLQKDKDVDVIYSDEDKTNEEGDRFDAFFKPDFSPDLLQCVNYMPHFLVVRKSLGDGIGWFQDHFEGAQDYDLILRLVEKTHRVVHIPKVLYHWRVWRSSTSGGGDLKPYANASGKKALQEHFQRIGVTAKVEDGYATTFYRGRPIFSQHPLISIIIPVTKNGTDIERCIHSIQNNTAYSNWEIRLVTTGDTDQEMAMLFEKLEQDPRVHLLKWGMPINYLRINNWAVSQSNGDLLVFLSGETEIVNNEWLEQMLFYAIRPDVGAVGAKLYYPDGTVKHAGIIVGIAGVAGYSHRHFAHTDPGYFFQLVLPHNVSAVALTCLMVRKQVFQEVNGFDEKLNYELGGVDMCLRILIKGYLNVWTPYSELIHFGAEPDILEDPINATEEFQHEIGYFQKNWAEFLKTGDPYYNSNFSRENEVFTFCLPNPSSKQSPQ